MASGTLGKITSTTTGAIASSVGGLTSKTENITGTTNNAVTAVEYTGVNTDSATTTVDNKERTITVAVSSTLLDKKQDTIQFVTLGAGSGTLTSDQLTLLTVQKVNRIILGTSVFYLSRIDGNEVIYISQKLDTDGTVSSMYEIRIDSTTGTYTSKALVLNYVLETAFESHVNNKDVHIQAGERDFWDSKATVDEGSERLTLTASK
jgi:hypothetical protein